MHRIGPGANVRQRIAYGRVSTQQQADQGALERQEKALLETAGADQVILDVGSGKTTSRPGYQQLLELIAAGSVEQVLVADQDRLNRNLQADLELWALCDANATRITDLNGREIEFRSPDGELLSTVVSALNQHRSRAYGAKTRRGLEQARDQGLPARPRVPFGFRKVRDERGRLIGIEPDPGTAHLARERIDWFLSGKGLTGTCSLIGKNHPRETWMPATAFKRWLKNPSLTGRLCWHKQGNSGDFAHVEAKPSFQGLISDSEAEQISSLLEALATGRARAGRATRTMSGLAKCADCKQTLSHKRSGNSTWYLRCSNPYCKWWNKAVRVDRVRKMLKGAMALHAAEIAKLTREPEVEAPEVFELKKEIKTLKNIRGTEELIRQKQLEIDKLLSANPKHAEYLLIAALTDLSFWEQPEEQLNSRLTEFVDYVQVQLAKTVAESKVCAIAMKTPRAPHAAIWQGNQDEVMVPMPGGIYWRRNPDNTKSIIAYYRLPELIREVGRTDEYMKKLGDLGEKELREMSQAELAEIKETMENASSFGIDPRDKTIEHEEVIWHYPAT